jgi:hypothetical protein
MALTGGRFITTVATAPSRSTLTNRSCSGWDTIAADQKVNRSMPPATWITCPVM